METITLTALLWRAATVIVLVAANAFFVAAEFALVAARRTRLDSMARRGDAKAKLASRAIQSLDRYISGTQLGITPSYAAYWFAWATFFENTEIHFN